LKAGTEQLLQRLSADPQVAPGFQESEGDVLGGPAPLGKSVAKLTASLINRWQSSGFVTSATTARTLPPAALISSAAICSTSARRPQMETSAPTRDRRNLPTQAEFHTLLLMMVLDRLQQFPKQGYFP
jgi:hypothetical protein